MKKRILIATDCFLPRWDGIARFLNEIIPKMSDEFQISVVCPEFPGEKEHYKNVKVYYFKPTIKIADITLSIPDKTILNKIIEKSDIIFSQTIGPIGTTTVNLAKKQNKKIVSFVHSIEWELFSKSVGGIFKDIIYYFTKWKVKSFYKKCTKIIVPSEEIGELFEWMKIKPQKVVVHLGTDSDKFSPAKNKYIAKQIANVPDDKIIIGYVGRIAREKDVITLYHAFVRLRKEYQNISLLIIGNGLKELIDVMNKKNVTILPAQNDVSTYYKAMDIFVQPSLTETTSLTVMEAMSTGLAVVSTKVGFIKNYITNKKNGLFFEKQNAYSLSTKIEILLNNKELREQLGNNARETIVKQFQWKDTAEKIKNVLKEV